MLLLLPPKNPFPGANNQSGIESDLAFDNLYTNQPLDVAFDIPDNSFLANMPTDSNTSNLAIPTTVGHA